MASGVLPLLAHSPRFWISASMSIAFMGAPLRASTSAAASRPLSLIARAGQRPWPKLFHNMRSTRQTELTEDFPTHVVCAWLGNSPAVAQAHYLQIRDRHFDLAAGLRPGSALQNALPQGAERPRTGPQPALGEVA